MQCCLTNFTKAEALVFVFRFELFVAFFSSSSTALSHYISYITDNEYILCNSYVCIHRDAQRALHTNTYLNPKMALKLNEKFHY